MNTTKIKPICIGKPSFVLPLSYDDSLSYYETLCKLVGKMNQLIEYFNNNVDESIVEYIDKRFNDIMLDTVYDEETETLTLSLKTKE